MLHIVKSLTAFNELVALYRDGDQVLLIENAVYASNAQHPIFPILKELEVYVLSADVQARGIQNRVSPSCRQISFADFVDLTAAQKNSLTWN
ncbi:sulfurtransferase complex subunit TusB [Vibrio sp. 404]|uniref:Sulfurtransferase complex subunit TusB n=1 Tax=Vibrio marinisediminis TaxID=2758441 RepID=A0A7W2FUR1_9VIBR|nr:sulfurtransferase complex subunit TusB [Vibrio marinisediminis]MBA5764607.1 sulfurtransferase complex subunit TusB [Vibrio marinisediminis]